MSCDQDYYSHTNMFQSSRSSGDSSTAAPLVALSSSSNMTSEPVIFELELEDALVINKVISEIHDPDDNSILMVDANGLRMVSTGDRTSQVSAFFSRMTFNRFVFNTSGQVKFRFVLKDFIETLNLLQDDAKDDEPKPAKVSLKINYRKRGDPLRLRLENNSNYTVNCDLREFSLPSVHTLMSFTPHEEITDIVFHSRELYKFLSGLDLSSQFVTLKLEPGNVPVKWMAGGVELEVGTEDEPAIIKRGLNAPSNLVFDFAYRTQLLKPAFMALRSSTSMLLRCGSSGLLIMEHFHDSQSVEYYVPREASDIYNI